jgi:hypothetical protein
MILTCYYFLEDVESMNQHLRLFRVDWCTVFHNFTTQHSLRKRHSCSSLQEAQTRDPPDGSPPPSFYTEGAEADEVVGGQQPHRITAAQVGGVGPENSDRGFGGGPQLRGWPPSAVPVPF